jgi:hypothetical protein
MLLGTALDSWPHEVFLNKPILLEQLKIDAWCLNTFGEYDVQWRGVNNAWQFRHLEDAVLFQLTWGYHE